MLGLYIGLGFIAWMCLGHVILFKVIDTNCELTDWASQAVAWLQFLITFLWPIVAVFYMVRVIKNQMK